LSIRGRVAEITPEGAASHFKQLIGRYLGQEEYRFGKPGQVRLLLKVAPERVRS